MLADGLIGERKQPASPPAPRTSRGVAPTRFFRLTALGRSVARAETKRLEALVSRSRTARLLKGGR
jgi:hypothetical protein